MAIHVAHHASDRVCWDTCRGGDVTAVHTGCLCWSSNSLSLQHNNPCSMVARQIQRRRQPTYTTTHDNDSGWFCAFTVVIHVTTVVIHTRTGPMSYMNAKRLCTGAMQAIVRPSRKTRIAALACIAAA